MRRIPRRGCLLAVVLVGTACSSGSKSAGPLPSATSQPATLGTGSVSTSGSATGAGRCASAPAAGASGGGDVLVPGDIPDNQAFVVYRATTDGYHLSVPEGWARSAPAGGAVTFTDKFNSIRVQVTPAPSAPSIASVQSTEVPALAASTPCFQAGQVSTVVRTAGPAVRITYRADSPPDPVTDKVVRLDVERYEFWQAGRLAALTLSSPQGSDNVDPWKRVTGSFAWGP